MNTGMCSEISFLCHVDGEGCVFVFSNFNKTWLIYKLPTALEAGKSKHQKIWCLVGTHPPGWYLLYMITGWKMHVNLLTPLL